MQTASRLAVEYALNSFWQLPLLFVAAEMIVRLLGRTRGKILCFVWWVALILALLAPASGFLSLPPHPLDALFSTHAASQQRQALTEDRQGILRLSPSGLRTENPNQVDRSLRRIPGIVLTCIFYCYLGSILIALVRLSRGLWETNALMRSARELPLDDELLSTWESCKTSMKVNDVMLRSTVALGSPAALHWPRPIVLLPSKLQTSDSIEIRAVFCHELAHVRRNDFIWNIAIEFFGVLLFYHPAFHWMRRRIQETRELACDDMAADAMRGRQEYAGWLLAGSKPANYDTGVDKTTVNNGQPSAFLRSTVPSTEGFGTLMQMINAADYAGKRVRLRAWVKSQDVADWAGVWMRVDKESTTFVIDNMQKRPIKGTQSWTMHDVVLDVPQGSTGIAFGILLSGTGQVWMNDVTFEVVDDSVPVTAVPFQSKASDHPVNLKFTE